jgi:hypothetical protein
LTAQFPGVAQPSGAAIFIAPDHPDYPPTWLTRHYGVLCVGWPGVEAKPFRRRSNSPPLPRLIHRGAANAAMLKAAYEAYTTARP